MTSPAQYRKRPIVIEAVQWTGDNFGEVDAFAGGNFLITDGEDRANSEDPESTATFYDRLHSTRVLVYDGDWIINGIQGEFYPCRPDVFAATYEPAEVQR
jgi:hypothetical protein